MIKIQHISKKYGSKPVLEDINLTLKCGGTIALVGENGAGKSTLLRIICGYISPSSGQVSVCDNDVGQNRINALKCIGYVPEISNLYGDMAVYDFLSWIAHLRDVKNTDEAIWSAAKNMHITDILLQKIDTLSKGYKKRVEIASAVLHQPDVLILDEPTDGLDPNQKRDIRRFIKQYSKKHIVLLSTHVLEDTEEAGRIIMLAGGKIIKDTSIEEFKKISVNKNLGEAFHLLATQAKEAE